MIRACSETQHGYTPSLSQEAFHLLHYTGARKWHLVARIDCDKPRQTVEEVGECPYKVP